MSAIVISYATCVYLSSITSRRSRLLLNTNHPFLLYLPRTLKSAQCNSNFTRDIHWHLSEQCMYIQARVSDIPFIVFPYHYLFGPPCQYPSSLTWLKSNCCEIMSVTMIVWPTYPVLLSSVKSSVRSPTDVNWLLMAIRYLFFILVVLSRYVYEPVQSHSIHLHMSIAACRADRRHMLPPGFSRGISAAGLLSAPYFLSVFWGCFRCNLSSLQRPIKWSENTEWQKWLHRTVLITVHLAMSKWEVTRNGLRKGLILISNSKSYTVLHDYSVNHSCADRDRELWSRGHSVETKTLGMCVQYVLYLVTDK